MLVESIEIGTSVIKISNTKAYNHRFSGIDYQDVGWLEIAMDGGIFMGGMNDVTDTSEYIQTFSNFELKGIAVEVNWKTVDSLDDHIRLAIVGFSGFDRNRDIRVPACGKLNSRTYLESLQNFVVARGERE